MENNRKTIIYEEEVQSMGLNIKSSKSLQIFGKRIKSIDVDVHSFILENSEIYTIVSNNKIKTEIVSNLPTTEEVKSGQIKYITDHIDDINEYIKVLGTDEQLNHIEFLSMMSYQLIQTYKQ